MGEVLRGHHERMAGRHPSVGLHRNIGLFGILELVRNRETMEPLSPFNSMNEVMGQVNRFLLDNGVYTMIRWHGVMTNPPLCINEEQLGEAFDVMDKALEIADQAMER
jgi:taurine--2-oxoglutarate transaminase